MTENRYGDCSVCGYDLIPVWFTEYETIKNRKTGRYRIACSHLECPNCWDKITVDDTFDGHWINPLV